MGAVVGHRPPKSPSVTWISPQSRQHGGSVAQPAPGTRSEAIIWHCFVVVLALLRCSVLVFFM